MTTEKPEHCPECDPSFGCFDGSQSCQKRPAEKRCKSGFPWADEKPEPHPELSEMVFNLVEDVSGVRYGAGYGESRRHRLVHEFCVKATTILQRELERETAGLRERAEAAERAKFGTPCKCESWIETCRVAEEELSASKAEAESLRAELARTGLPTGTVPHTVYCNRLYRTPDQVVHQCSRPSYHAGECSSE